MNVNPWTPQMVTCARKGAGACNLFDSLRERYERAGITFPALNEEVEQYRNLFETVLKDAEVDYGKGQPK